MFLIKTKNKCLINGQLKVLRQSTGRFFSKDNNDDKINAENVELPPEPTTCCMSGCANCVWIDYAEQIIKLYNIESDEAKNIILDKISDPNLKAFLQLELNTRLPKKS